MFIYAFCSKCAFCRKLILRIFCNGTSKQSLTSKPSLTIALKILKTIEKPLTPMVGPSKNIQWWWSNIVKTIEKPLKSMVAWKKSLTIPSLWKIDHHCGLERLLLLQVVAVAFPKYQSIFHKSDNLRARKIVTTIHSKCCFVFPCLRRESSHSLNTRLPQLKCFREPSSEAVATKYCGRDPSSFF